MSELLLLALGYATRHDLMPEVVANRVSWGHLPADTDPASCVALLDCQYLGDTVFLDVQGVTVPVTVCDCAKRNHWDRLQRQGWAVDLSPELAERVQLPQRNVRIWSANPRLKNLQSH